MEMMTLNLKTFSPLNVIQPVVSALPPIITVILAVILASTLATITWKFFPASSDIAPPVFNQASSKQMTSQSALNADKRYKQIPNWHLFGDIQKKTAPKAPVVAEAPEDVPDTQLRLTLKGVVASTNMQNGWAIIANRLGKEDSYGIDSSLPGGATLKEIYTDRIILLHNGRLETLRLPKMDVASATNKSSSHRSRNTRRNNKARTTRLGSSGKVNHVSSAGSAMLRDYREKLLTDPQSVMNSVRAEPYRQAGKLKGYRIFPGRDKRFFGQLGLEPGDVVISVNDIALDSPLKGLEVMQNVTEASEVSVEILRNGVNQTFLVPMN